MQSVVRKHSALLMAMFAIVPFTLIGCENSVSKNETAGSTKMVNGLPASALRFHKPKELKVAVNRMRELHDAITKSETLPSPIEYQIKEVIHRSGASSHSHYYLHDPDSTAAEPDHHDTDPFTGEASEDHDHETSEEKIHDVSVDAFTELKDLSKWLPKIASDSNMGESDWTKVSDVSKQLTPMLNEIVEQATDNDKRRPLYYERADAISVQLVALKEITK